MSSATTSVSVRTLRVKQIRSTIGRPKDQEATLRSLGIRRMHHTVEVQDNPSIRGMINKIRHLVEVDEIGG